VIKMTYRSLGAIVFAIIIAVEIFLFLQTTPTFKTETTGSGKWIGSKQVIDYQSEKGTNFKYAVIIGSTVIFGGIVILSTPNTKIKGND
jgi:hypothetical protein